VKGLAPSLDSGRLKEAVSSAHSVYQGLVDQRRNVLLAKLIFDELYWVRVVMCHKRRELLVPGGPGYRRGLDGGGFSHR
jgi:hypothetical protein